MQKVLTFPVTAEGRTLFTTLWDGITLGASDGRPKDRDRRGAIAKVQRILVAVSTQVEPCPTDRPMKARVLKEGEQRVLLYGAQVALINELLNLVAWGGATLLDVAALDDVLGSLPDAPAE